MIFPHTIAVPLTQCKLTCTLVLHTKHKEDNNCTQADGKSSIHHHDDTCDKCCRVLNQFYIQCNYVLHVVYSNQSFFLSLSTHYIVYLILYIQKCSSRLFLVAPLYKAIGSKFNHIYMENYTSIQRNQSTVFSIKLISCCALFSPTM